MTTNDYQRPQMTTNDHQRPSMTTNDHQRPSTTINDFSFERYFNFGKSINHVSNCWQ